ncbi:hypothetical protein JS55_02325 [Rickettsia felis str. LSU]|nr:hypothetical protein JS55_02325 [Rickettsia felis str. LSU]
MHKLVKSSLKFLLLFFLAFLGDLAPKVCILWALSKSFISAVLYLFCLINRFKLSSAVIFP